MRYATETDMEPKLTALLAAAQDEPVFIEQGQQSVAVLVSMREYDRLNRAANTDFQQFCDTVSDKAAFNGLTDATLNALLRNA